MKIEKFGITLIPSYSQRASKSTIVSYVIKLFRIWHVAVVLGMVTIFEHITFGFPLCICAYTQEPPSSLGTRIHIHSE